ncbi:MAG TPA: methyltransferase domain-containing protein [Bryobacteraceae bacterium]|nr:methyltransferase domain-containing protein [Bryobacteraceae bacterium]
MKQEWFETFFRGVAVELWSRVLPSAVTEAEVAFLEQELAPPVGGRILDVPCGHGRHSIELVKHGFRITGVDLSEDCLAVAQKSAPQLDWRSGDMRSLELEPATYDGAFCFGNSFGYLDHAGAAAFLRGVARALKPGARFVIDTGTVAESILPAMLKTRWHRAGDIFMLSENRYVAEESRLDIDYTFIQGGRVETRASSSYVITVAELRRLFRDAGFEVTGMYGSVTREPYQLGSPRMMMVGRRA